MECFHPLKDVKSKFYYSDITVTCLTLLLISVVCLSVWALVEGRVQPWVSVFTWHLWDRSLIDCIFRGSCPWASQVALPHLHRAVECPDYRPSCPALHGARDLNPGPHTCRASPLRTEPSPLSFTIFTFFFLCHWRLNPGLCAHLISTPLWAIYQAHFNHFKEFSVVLIIFIMFSHLVKLFILQNWI